MSHFLNVMLKIRWWRKFKIQFARVPFASDCFARPKSTCNTVNFTRTVRKGCERAALVDESEFFEKKKKQNAALKCPNRVPRVQVKKDLGTPCPPVSFSHQLFISLHHHTMGATHPRHVHAYPCAHRHAFFKSLQLNPCIFFLLPRSWHPCRPPAGSGRCCGVRSVLPGEAGCAGDSGRSWGWGECLSACTPPAHKRMPSDDAPLFDRFFVISGAVAQLQCGKRLLRALIGPLMTRLNRYPPPLLCLPTCVHLVNFCSVLVTRECSGSFHRRDFPSL